MTFDSNRHEVHHGLIHWQSYAPLAPEKLRGACDAARKRDMNFPVGAIDHGLAHFCALCIRGGEISNILCGEIWIEASDKDRRAHNLRKARRVMHLGITWGWNVRRIELQSFRACHEGLRG